MQIKGNTHFVLAISVILAMALIFVLISVDSSFYENDRMAEVNLDQPISALEVSYAEYAIWTLKFRESTFEWNLRSTKIIFWVSIIVSMSGIMFAFWQFLDAGEKDQAAAEADELEVKTALASVAFKSRSLASLVLFVSIAYLLIYVNFVYPIKSTHDELDFEQAVQNLDAPMMEAGAIVEAGPAIGSERLGAPDAPSPSNASVTSQPMLQSPSNAPSAPVSEAVEAVKGQPAN